MHGEAYANSMPAPDNALQRPSSGQSGRLSRSSVGSRGIMAIERTPSLDLPAALQGQSNTALEPERGQRQPSALDIGVGMGIEMGMGMGIGMGPEHVRGRMGNGIGSSALPMSNRTD